MKRLQLKKIKKWIIKKSKIFENLIFLCLIFLLVPLKSCAFIFLLVNMKKRVLHDIENLANIAGINDPRGLTAFSPPKAVRSEAIAYGAHANIKPTYLKNTWLYKIIFILIK